MSEELVAELRWCVLPTLGNAAADEIERLTKLISDCEIYLKDGETPQQRMDRDNADVLGLMKQLVEVKTALATAREDALREAAEVAESMCSRAFTKRQIMKPQTVSNAIRALIDKRCPTCRSQGFQRSKVFPDQCEFCDGTFNGETPGYD